jgi:hypothetical protein
MAVFLPAAIRPSAKLTNLLNCSFTAFIMALFLLEFFQMQLFALYTLQSAKGYNSITLCRTALLPSQRSIGCPSIGSNL